MCLKLWAYSRGVRVAERPSSLVKARGWEWADSSQSSALSWAGHSAWTRCTCAQGAACAEGLLVSEHYIWTMRHLRGTPQASLARVPKSSTVIIICTRKTYLFGEYFCWDCLTIYEVKKIHRVISLWRVLESSIKCSQSRERCSGTAVPPASSSRPCSQWSVSIHLLSPEQHLRKAYFFLCGN